LIIEIGIEIGIEIAPMGTRLDYVPVFDPDPDPDPDPDLEGP